MELLFKTAILVIAIIIIIAAAFLLVTLFTGSGSGFTEAQAVSLIETDLKQHYPSGVIAILNTSPSQHEGSWDIVARIIYGQETACPTVMTESFDYPATGLLNASTVYSNYSNGMCHVYAGMANSAGLGSSIVGLWAIAIATPLNQSFAPLVQFVDSNGYSSIRAHAGQAMYADATNMITSNQINVTSTSVVWLINYTATQTNSTLHVYMDTSGQVLYNYTT